MEGGGGKVETSRRQRLARLFERVDCLVRRNMDASVLLIPSMNS